MYLPGGAIFPAVYPKLKLGASHKNISGLDSNCKNN